MKAVQHCFTAKEKNSMNPRLDTLWSDPALVVPKNFLFFELNDIVINKGTLTDGVFFVDILPQTTGAYGLAEPSLHRRIMDVHSVTFGEREDSGHAQEYT